MQQIFDFKSNLVPSLLPGQRIQQFFRFSPVSSGSCKLSAATSLLFKYCTPLTKVHEFSVEDASLDQVHLDQTVAKDLGTIVVQIYTGRAREIKSKRENQGKYGKRTSRASSSQPGLSSAENDPETGMGIVLAEKAMKGKLLSHGTR
jgi:hypothetical protein